ncbi:MAG: response regulator [Treponema sp.]|nr:response regulator [Treponema sp.]
MIILLTVTAVVVSRLNQLNLQEIYETNFTERALLTNALIATLIDRDVVQYYVELLQNMDEDFKRQQVDFFNARQELFRLQERGATEEEQAILLDRMKAFHREISGLKTEQYWSVVESLRQLRDLSRSKYVYVIADTGMFSDDGDKLHTYVFDADDYDEFNEPDDDGLGILDIAEELMSEVYETKKAMDRAEYYTGNYGELYYAYAPVLDKGGNVIAILGTDLDPGEMRKGISKSTLTFNMLFLVTGIIIIITTYFFIMRYVTKPLGALTSTAQKLADGHVYTFVPDMALKQKSELGILAHVVNDMSGVYRNMIKSTEDLLGATQIGKLEVRNDASKYKGDIRKVLEQINDTLDSMILYLNSLPEGIFIMSKNFEMHFRNKQYINFFGDKTASEFFAEIFPEEPEKHFAELIEQPNNNIAIWINELCFSITLKEIVLSNRADENSVMVIAVDITDLMKEKDNAQAAAKAKSEFLSRMSHEMRTPMNAIIGMAKIANDTEDVSKLKYCLSTINTSSKLLLGIINDVLDMAKIEAGKFDLENVSLNLNKLLVKIGNIIRENMVKKNLKFDMILPQDLHIDYSGDELRLSQVVTNLLSNAIKFTPENGKITLSIEEVEQQGNFSILHFSISDTGIGMTKDQINRLFTSFEQADGSITRRFGGTGLGLAISKSIVEKMGGLIWVESEYGKSSTFNFNIKLERIADTDDQNIETDKTREVPDLSDISILLVEDVEINREIFLALLEATKIKIDTAENGLIAVTKFIENPDKYDVIIMDIQMPEMDGYGATRNIRAFETELRFIEESEGGIKPRQQVPIIAMTANAFKEDIERCLESGMNDHLSKPIDEVAVIEKIMHYSGRR